MNRRPERSEYADYWSRYIDLVSERDVLALLEKQGRETQDLLATIDESRAGFRYAPGKWSIRQLVGHVEDAERVFAYRALTFARGDKASLPGFEQDDWMKTAPFDATTLRERAAALASVRSATVALFRSLDDEAWERTGIASNNPISVRALAYVAAGHERHHLGILRERYLK